MSSKLTTKMIQEIRDKYENTYLNQTDLARMYKVSRSTIRRYIADIPKTKKKIEFYKTKYMIALYDENDNLFNIFDNVYEMAKNLKRTENSLGSSVSRNKRIRHKKRWYNIKFIEI